MTVITVEAFFSGNSSWSWGDRHGKSASKFTVLKLNVEKKSRHFLHLRALEVYGEDGFQIAFERSRQARRDACSLSTCSFNGKCLVDVRDERLSDFRCECARPKGATVVESAFEGKRCSAHKVAQNGACPLGGQIGADICNKRGTCR